MGSRSKGFIRSVPNLRITESSGSVSVEIVDHGNASDLPGPVKAWATLNEGHGLAREQTRLVFSRSRFLISLPSIIRLRSQLGLLPRETETDAKVDQLIAKWVGESADWEKATSLSESPRSLSKSDVSGLLQRAEFIRLDELRNHQWDSILKMVNLPHSANFNVPGAGKTTALLAVHAIEKELRGDLKLLVIAPRNVMGAWDNEIKKCLANPPEIVRLRGGRNGVDKALNQKPQISIMTYEQLRSTWDIVLKFAETHPLHLVLDESHRAKSGFGSAQGSAVLEIAPAAIRRDILSGTPMPQGLQDLCAQFSFLWPLQGDICGKHLGGGELELSAANKFLEPLFTRVTKQDLGLPPVEFPSDYLGLHLAPHQQAAYNMLRAEATRRYRTSTAPADEKLKALGKQVVNLIQIASNPNLAFKRLKDDVDLRDASDFLEELRLACSEPSAKFAALRQLVDKLLAKSGEKVVIWSGYVDTIEMIASEFAEYGPLVIHGGVKTGSEEDIEFREARVKLFNTDDRYRIIVANPAAGGEGISLHEGAHNAIYFDRNFNATHFLQSVDRIHRLGLPEGTVTRVFLLEAAGTVDEIIDERLNKKIEAMNAVLNLHGLSTLTLDDDEEASLAQNDEAGATADDLEYINSKHFDGLGD